MVTKSDLLEGIYELNRTFNKKIENLAEKIDRASEKECGCLEDIDGQIRRFIDSFDQEDRYIAALHEMQELLMKKMNIFTNDIRGVHSVNGDKYAVVETECYGRTFLWVCSQFAKDTISEYAKQGKSCMDPGLFTVFQEKQGVFLDLGANIGAFSLPFAAHGWKGYAFEAGQKNSDVLEKSILLNDFDITVIGQAVYDRTGCIKFVENGPWGSVENNFFKDNKAVILDTIALDDWYEGVGIEQIDLIKIDIEGSEVAAFRGMKKMLQKYHCPPIYTEVNLFALALQGESEYSYFTEAEELGYHVYELYDGKLYEYSKDLFPLNYCRDYIFLNEIPDYLEDRVFGRIANNDGRVEQILSRLKKYKQWPKIEKYGDLNQSSDFDFYICYCIKDYPEFLTDEVKKVLFEIKEYASDHLFIQQLLSWMKV